jgi:hypothetical protein
MGGGDSLCGKKERRVKKLVNILRILHLPAGMYEL